MAELSSKQQDEDHSSLLFFGKRALITLFMNLKTITYTSWIHNLPFITYYYIHPPKYFLRSSLPYNIMYGLVHWIINLSYIYFDPVYLSCLSFYWWVIDEYCIKRKMNHHPNTYMLTSENLLEAKKKTNSSKIIRFNNHSNLVFKTLRNRPRCRYSSGRH